MGKCCVIYHFFRLNVLHKYTKVYYLIAFVMGNIAMGRNKNAIAYLPMTSTLLMPFS